jgi:gliding motility-associated-like protein
VTDGDGDIATKPFTVNIAFNDTDKPVVADGKFYESATPVNLLELVTGDGLLWYAAETGGTGSAVTPTPVTTVGTQEFWVTQTIGVCESPRAKITVTLDATEIAGYAGPKTAPYQFSSLVDDQITIAGSGNIPAAKVFIANGFASGDELICATAMPEGVTNIYNTSTGELMFTGNASAAAWQTVFRNVRFRTASSDTDDRIIHFSLGSAKDHAATIQRNTGDAVTLSKSSIDEGMATESPVGTFAVNGVDAGLTFTYEFIPGTGDEDNLSLAILNDGLKTAVVPDYESQTRFNIRVRVTDNFNKSYEQTFSVSVNNLNDTKPVITASQPLNLDENSSAGVIATAMKATDADGTTNFAWTIVGGNTKNAFTIDPSTGEITVADDSSLDYEVLSTYTLTVMVNDGLNDSEPTEVVINVNNLNDSRPVITAGQRFNLDENSTEGTSVCYVEATDPDGVTTFEGWTIIEGNIGAAFTIDPSTGEITVADVPALDHETRASYTLLISVSDGINTSEHKAVAIHLNNLNDNLPSDILLSNDRFSESESSGTSIGTFSTVDPDMESSQTYILVPGAGDADNSKFAIDGDQLVTAATYDYDFEKVLTIRVRMTDSRSDSYEKIFTITVEADKDIQLAIPTAFSPNGDQVNDTWEIDRLLSYPESVVKVFNSDGMEVFSNTGYTAQWDGTHKGRQQAFGTYYYIVRLNDGSGKTFKGTVMIIK